MRLRHLAEDPLTEGLEPRAPSCFEPSLDFHTGKLSKLRARTPAADRHAFSGDRVMGGVRSAVREPTGVVSATRRPLDAARQGTDKCRVALRKPGLAVALACALASASAFGDAGDDLRNLHRLRDDALRASGASGYAALRRLWQEWDMGEPALVEDALREAAAASEVAPPLRAYAGLLGAYARRRRGDLDGARKQTAELGFVSRWMTVGPFDNEGKAGLLVPFGPEVDAVSADGAGDYAGKERSVRWRVVPPIAGFGWLDFGALVRPAEKVCAYARTYVRDDRRDALPRPISIWTGSAGAMRVFWNGAEVLRDDGYRDLDAERLATTVRLAPGWNRLLIKVCGDETGPMVAVRLADATGAPDAHLLTDASPGSVAQSERPGSAPATHGRPASPPPPLSVGRVEGPLQAFERMAAASDPSQLEAFARYLRVTQSDDPTQHQARELARRAATAAPSISRLLLAGELAEGRNQRAVWIAKAEALVRLGAGTTAERLDVLLARAGHERRGVNRRDAIPYYEAALSLDPDSIEATLARVELYAAAGLHETALAILKRALSRRPRCATLLRAMNAALLGEDRVTEADEIAERYAQVRFDDAGFVRGHVERSLAQRDALAVSRWLDRLLAINPDSGGALRLAAHTLAQLGDPRGAIAMYRRALELAPEDTDAMRSLAEAFGRAGERDEEVRLLRQVLLLLPQSKDVRDYVMQLVPGAPRPDEAFARPAAEFLALRGASADGFARRTLVDLTATTVFPNGLASRFHQIVFQPLTESAAAEARDYAFSFESETEAVQLRGARVYRSDGKIDEALDTGEAAADNPALSTYTSARAYYVRFPRLHPNDVVEILYRVEDIAPRNAFADYFGEVVYLQSTEPVLRAEYDLITPKGRTFYFNEPAIPNLARSAEEGADTRVYRFVATNVPPVVPERSEPPLGELLGHVHVSTYRSWEVMAAWYWGLVKDQFVADDEVRKRAVEATKGLTDERAKVRAVYDYVVEKTRYVALEFGIHGFKPYSCAQIFARGFGDCKDKATLIVTMLQHLGIRATIVIVRTGLKGDFESSPASLAPFDHAIAYVPSLDLYLDGTAEYTGSSELPAMDRGALAVQVNEGAPKLVHLPDPPASESVATRRVEIGLGEGAAADVDWRLTVSGVTAASYRQRYRAASSRLQRLVEDLGDEFGGISNARVDTNSLEDIELPVSLRLRGRAGQLVRRDGERLTVPLGPRAHLVRDWAPLSARRTDVRLLSRSTSVSDWTLHIPSGMRVITPPLVQDVVTRFGGVRVKVEALAGAIHVVTTVSLDESRVRAVDYPAFRAFCEAGDRALGQTVVLAR